jgi:cytosine/adenosine deaminase-related metal-dependent hydrolase
MADIFEKYHLKGTLAFETTNRYGTNNRDRIIKENITFYNSKRYIKGMFGMHALLTLGENDLKEISNAIPEDMPVHIHIAEGEADERLSKMNFGMPIINVLDKFGLLRDNSLLVHNSNISDDEMEILKDKNLFLVQAIDSNMNNAQNIANIHKFIQSDLDVTIGSDGMTSNILRLYKNSFLFTKYQNKTPDIGFEEINKMLLTSYKLKTAYGFPVGLSEDEPADFAITNYSPYTPFDSDNFLGHFIYGVTENKINHLFSNGHLVLENGKIVDKSIEKISKEAINNSIDLFDRFLKN